MNGFRFWRSLFIAVALFSGLAALPWTDPWFEDLWRFFKPGVTSTDLVKLHVVKAALVALSVGLAMLAVIPHRWVEAQALRMLLLGCLVLFGGAAIAGSIRMAAVSARVVVEPDLSEYIAGARSVYSGESYGFEINGHKVPSRYPPGASFMYAAFAGLLGTNNAGFGPLCFGVAAIIFTAMAAPRLCRRRLADETIVDQGRVAAILAVAFLVGSPAALKFFSQPMSEAPSISLVALAGFLALTGEHTLLRAALLGWIVSAAVAVRLTNAVVLLPLAVFFALARPRSPARILVLLICGAVPLGFMAAYQAATFGSPFQTGYDFWSTGAYASENFALNYALARPGGGDTWLPNLLIYTLELLAIPVNPFGALWLPGTALLAVLALRRGAMPRPSSDIACFSLAITLVLFVPYSFQDSRFLLPLLPLGAMVLAPTIAASFLSAKPISRYVRMGLLVSSLCLACGIAHGYASWLLTRPSKAEFAADVANHTEPNAVVVSPLDAATFSSFVTVDSRFYVPLSVRIAHTYLLERRGVTFGAVEHLDRLIELARARPVYLDTRFGFRDPEMLERLRSSLSWQPVNGESALLRLVTPPAQERTAYPARANRVSDSGEPDPRLLLLSLQVAGRRPALHPGSEPALEQWTRDSQRGTTPPMPHSSAR